MLIIQINKKYPVDRRPEGRMDTGYLFRAIKKPLGNDLLSQEVALQVPSALISLTTGFEMLPGVPLSLRSPETYFTKSFEYDDVIRMSY